MRRAPGHLPARIALAAGLFLSLSSSLPARGAPAEPAIIAGAPQLDEATGELVLYLSGRAADGSPTTVADPQIFLDGRGPLSPTGRDKVLDYAGDHPRWTPPFAIGVVYLWSKGAPPIIMDGLEALFRHVPSRVAVYPTPYGQGHRQVVSKLTAARVAGGELADYPQIAGDQLKLGPAVLFNAGKLAEDREPIKLLLIISDGRGPGPGPAAGRGSPFAALGEDLRRRNIQPTILGLPSPTDPTQSAANLAQLAEAAQARLIRVEGGADIAASIEALAEPLSAFDRVRFEIPWLASQLGGEYRVAGKGTVAGTPLRSAPLLVVLPRRGQTLVLILGGLLVAMVGLASVRRALRRPAPVTLPSRASFSGPPTELRPPPRNEPPPPASRRQEPREAAPPRRPDPRGAAAVDATAPGHQEVRQPPARQPRPAAGPVRADVREETIALSPLGEIVEEVVRVGVTPARAVLALARNLGAHTDTVVKDDRLIGGRALTTRAGQSRLREIRKKLAETGSDQDFIRDVAPILSGGLREHISPADGARRLHARLAIEVWTSVLRLGPERLEAAVASAAAMYPDLGSPAGKIFVQEVRRELARPTSGEALVVWLVRVAGPGQHGQSVVLSGSTVIGGAGAETVLVTDDPRLLPRHAQILIVGNDATIVPLDGAIQIDGEPLRAAAPLHDGHTVGVGDGLYVARLVRRHVARGR